MIKPALIALALMAAIPAQATTYFLDFIRPVTIPGFTGPSPDFVQGTITTDCNNCVLTRSDIIDWDLIIATHGNLQGSILGPLSGGSSEMLFSGNNEIIATPTALFFNFATPNTALAFASSSSFELFQSTIYWANGSTAVTISPLDNLIGTAVPEPSTWALMLLGFAFIAIQLKRREWSCGHE